MTSIEFRGFTTVTGVMVPCLYSSIYVLCMFARLEFMEFGLKEALFFNAVFSGVLSLMCHKNWIINHHYAAAVLTISQILDLTLIVTLANLRPEWGLIRGPKLGFLVLWYLIVLQLLFATGHVILISFFFKKENLLAHFSCSALKAACTGKRVVPSPPQYSEVMQNDMIPPSYTDAIRSQPGYTLVTFVTDAPKDTGSDEDASTQNDNAFVQISRIVYNPHMSRYAY